MDADPDPDPAIFVFDLQDANKNCFSAYCFLKVRSNHFSKIKSHEEVKKNSRNQGFSYYFCLRIEGSGGSD
jgi:hypothetical protein